MSVTKLPLQIHHPSFSFYCPSFSSEASSGLQQAPCLQAGLQPNNTDEALVIPGCLEVLHLEKIIKIFQVFFLNIMCFVPQ